MGITGMAIGSDTAFAEACITIELPFIAAIPYQQQGRNWSFNDYYKYERIISNPLCYPWICNRDYEPSPNWIFKAIQDRNDWVIDHCTLLYGVYENSIDEVDGGTGYTLKRAKEVRREILKVWPW